MSGGIKINNPIFIPLVAFAGNMERSVRNQAAQFGCFEYAAKIIFPGSPVIIMCL
jgi:hypothetical protein